MILNIDSLIRLGIRGYLTAMWFFIAFRGGHGSLSSPPLPMLPAS